MIRTITAALVGLIVLVGCSSSDPTPMDAARAKVMVERAQDYTKVLNSAIDVFCLNTGRYPSEEEGLTALLTRPENAEGWGGPYFKDWKTIPEDPWGNAYRYVLKPRSSSTLLTTDNIPEETEVISLGADGEPGGTGLNADIVNGRVVGE